MKIKGYAAHFGTPNLNGEIVNKESFKSTVEFYNAQPVEIPITFNHDPLLILGHVEALRLDDDGLFIEAEINENLPIVRDYIAPLIKEGEINRFSTEGHTRRTDHGDGTFTSDEFFLTAVSIVPLPADMEAFFSWNAAHQRPQKPQYLGWWVL